MAQFLTRRRLASACAVALLTVAGVALADPAPADPAPTVTIDTGSLRGVDAGEGVTAYKGIPFAAPPVGPLRWQPPMPAAPWTGVRAAEAFGDSCMQAVRTQAAGGRAFIADTRPSNGVSEDCLSLNVWTAAKAGEKLPVMVWIYGGGFNVGSSSVPIYDGAGLATKGVVVVSINYRLGIFGFLADPALDAESSRHTSGNYGLLDQVAALQWVQRNVARFGGDPARVTIFGQSAGGGSVHFLSLSPLAKGLFRGAIAQNGLMFSGDPFLQERSPSAYKTLASAEADNKAYLTKAGIGSVAQLRSMTAEQINALPQPPFPPAFFAPIVDGWALPSDFASIYAKGGQTNVAFMAGWTSSYYSALKITVPEYRAWAHARFGALADRFLALYPAGTNDEALRQVEESTHDSYRSSLLMWAAERREHSSAPIYLWWFNHGWPGPDKNGWGARAGHDIPYAMNSLVKSQRPWDADDRAVAALMSGYWSGFAKRSDPNGDGRPSWPAYDAARPMLMQLGDDTHPIIAASPERLAFWKAYFLTRPECRFFQPCSINVP